MKASDFKLELVTRILRFYWSEFRLYYFEIKYKLIMSLLRLKGKIFCKFYITNIVLILEKLKVFGFIGQVFIMTDILFYRLSFSLYFYNFYESKPCILDIGVNYYSKIFNNPRNWIKIIVQISGIISKMGGIFELNTY